MRRLTIAAAVGVPLLLVLILVTAEESLAATCDVSDVPASGVLTAERINQRLRALQSCVNNNPGIASSFVGSGSVTDAVDLATAEVAGVIPTANMSTSVALIDNSRTYTANPVFEGSVVDAFKTTIAITNPTAARTITVKDASGTLAFTSDVGAGTLLRVPIVTTAGTTYTTGTGTTMLLVRLCGGGGGGGGGDSDGATTVGSGSGGGAGGYAEKAFTVTPSTAYTIAIGTAGTAGTAGPNAGGNGGNTTFTVGGVTVTAFGGQGGPSTAGGTSGAVVQRASATAISTNGDLNSGGAPGGYGFQFSTTHVSSGSGGSSQYGAGGQGKLATSAASTAGANGIGFCSGASGGVSWKAADAAGGTGAAGVIVTYEIL